MALIQTDNHYRYATLSVSDIRASVDFYTTKLGFTSRKLRSLLLRSNTPNNVAPEPPTRSFIGSRGHTAAW
jgi:hypothetical protein